VKGFADRLNAERRAPAPRDEATKKMRRSTRADEDSAKDGIIIIIISNRGEE
jgi:hypothetical protein